MPHCLTPGGCLKGTTLQAHLARQHEHNKAGNVYMRVEQILTLRVKDGMSLATVPANPTSGILILLASCKWQG
jgi:hypothetical protein